MTPLRIVIPLLGYWLLMALSPSSVAAFCFEEAGSANHIEPALLWAIASVESNFNPEQISHNPDGSLDIGLMQINSRWQPRLDPATWKELADPCTNVRVAADILSDCLDRYGYTWRGIGCYNAISEPKRARYAREVLKVMEQLQHTQDSGN